jgi:hypothetical protein
MIILTSNAAADEIQQIIKNSKVAEDMSELDREEKELLQKNQKNQEQKQEEEQEQEPDVIKTYRDPYAGPIEFLRSPIRVNFLTDLRKEISKSLEGSYLNPDKHIDYFIKTYNEKLQKSFTETSSIEDKKTEPISEIAPQILDLEIDEKKEETNKLLKEAVSQRLSTMFLPEFLNRLDDIIIFQPLKPNELRKICDIMIDEVTKRVLTKGVILTVENSVKVKLTKQGYNPIFGARPLRRLITKYIEDLVSEAILQNSIENRTNVGKGEYIFLNMTVDENSTIISVRQPVRKLTSEEEAKAKPFTGEGPASLTMPRQPREMAEEKASPGKQRQTI